MAKVKVKALTHVTFGHPLDSKTHPPVVTKLILGGVPLDSNEPALEMFDEGQEYDVEDYCAAELVEKGLAVEVGKA